MATGWGILTWGQSDRRDTNVYATGWGAKSWGEANWGDLSDETVSISGVSATTSVGTVDAYVHPGWGSLNWCENGW